MPIKAIAFDLIGTIVHVKPRREVMLKRLKKALENQGLGFNSKDFYETYRRVNKKYMQLRVSSLKEYSNPIIVAEALTKLGYQTKPDDPKVIEAIKEYFNPYLESIYTTPQTNEVLARLKDQYKLGIVTNFTFQWTVKESLKKVGLAGVFNPIIISVDVGYRKPHPSIFKAFTEAIKADEQTIVFVGDDLKRDIYGAVKSGMKTVLLSSGLTDTEDIFYEQKIHCQVSPQAEIKSLTELEDVIKQLDI